MTYKVTFCRKTIASSIFFAFSNSIKKTRKRLNKDLFHFLRKAKSDKLRARKKDKKKREKKYIKTLSIFLLEHHAGSMPSRNKT